MLLRISSGQCGLSLLEVLVYSVLAIAVLVFAVLGLSGMHRSAYRNQELSRMHNSGDEAVQTLARDVRNMGLKRVIYSPSPGLMVDTTLMQADFGAWDSSSFRSGDGNPYDTLVFIRPELDGTGKPTALDTITYSVDESTHMLLRSQNGGSVVEICGGVDALQFEFGVAAVKTQMAAENPPLLLHWTQSPSGTVAQSGSSLAATLHASGTATFWLSQQALNLSSQNTYQASMQAMASFDFLANVDSMNAILCNSSGTPLASQTFLPTASNTNIVITWSGISCSNCYAGFKMVMSGKGEFDLNAFRFSEVAQGNVTWVSQPTLAQKKAVKSLRIHLLTRSKQGLFGNHTDTLTLANATLTFNDKMGRSLTEETVAVPNNGY